MANAGGLVLLVRGTVILMELYAYRFIALYLSFGLIEFMMLSANKLRFSIKIVSTISFSFFRQCKKSSRYVKQIDYQTEKG